ncbi:hypothetical protein L6E12_11990 [Actinokineospora sp. PR83]|uniref:hypothetical protein n=1 Tax=Actinokineospora sp. PR83 TaxID=2884908 RepID=UPI001F2CF9D2|nr:hypothetical protein [Actinokineospora sp. PR83]MCG8916509.1 hypothetical protein [Actinokineospora sp. PR83]
MSEPAGQGRSTRRRRSPGARPTDDELLAAARAARHALHHDLDPRAEGELAAGFTTAAITNPDPTLLDAVDR